MKAPKDHWVIQIDVTNACIHTCSNCTRSCMHQKKPFMMDYETFCKAVDSIIDHPGLIGIMGGEPTLHPQFEQMCEYLREKLDAEELPEAEKLSMPTDDYYRMWKHYETEKREIQEYEDGPRAIIKGAGLFTSLTRDYLKFMEIIQDTFVFQNLNDHKAASLHQPVLISRKDMGIDDREWLKLRENCWINHTWSSSITPKGCFFCEIAAALDYMYDGPGGLPIEKGWWKRDISDFEEQFRWCELCGIPLKTFSRDARESITDVSNENLQLMKKHGCIRMDEEHLNVVKVENGEILEESKNITDNYVGRLYIEDKDRVATDASICAEEFFGIVVYADSDRKNAENAIENNKDRLKMIVPVRQSEGFESIRKAFDKIGKNKYVFCFTPDIVLSEGIKKLENCVVNPGTLHYIDFSKPHMSKNSYIENAKEQQNGICFLLNTSAHSLKYNMEKLEKDYTFLSDLKKVWAKGKVVELSDAMNQTIYNGQGLGQNELRILRLKSVLKNSGSLKTLHYLMRKVNNVATKKDKSLWI